ncbi:hypothetical protein F4778DRAFT_466744 [Xylariomycetidae sp. FL2044]|nr:hypothetical protein F4778DRAFT_466744 [Xylariomycetidae sp. FL2044]
MGFNFVPHQTSKRRISISLAKSTSLRSGEDPLPHSRYVRHASRLLKNACVTSSKDEKVLRLVADDLMVIRAIPSHTCGCSPRASDGSSFMILFFFFLLSRTSASVSLRTHPMGQVYPRHVQKRLIAKKKKKKKKESIQLYFRGIQCLYRAGETRTRVSHGDHCFYFVKAVYLGLPLPVYERIAQRTNPCRALMSKQASHSC